MQPQNREIPIPDLLSLTIEALGGEVSYLRVMSLGRPVDEQSTILRAAEKISRVSDSLEKMAKKSG